MSGNASFQGNPPYMQLIYEVLNNSIVDYNINDTDEISCADFGMFFLDSSITAPS